MVSGRNGTMPASLSTELEERFQGRSDAEANYCRAVYYLAGALWLVGAGDQALAALNELFAQATATTSGEPSGKPPC